MAPVQKMGRILLRSNCPMHHAKKNAHLLFPRILHAAAVISVRILPIARTLFRRRGGRRAFATSPLTGNGMFPMPPRLINAATSSWLDGSKIIAKSPALIAALMHLGFLRLVARRRNLLNFRHRISRNRARNAFRSSNADAILRMAANGKLRRTFLDGRGRTLRRVRREGLGRRESRRSHRRGRDVSTCAQVDVCPRASTMLSCHCRMSTCAQVSGDRRGRGRFRQCHFNVDRGRRRWASRQFSRLRRHLLARTRPIGQSSIRLRFHNRPNSVLTRMVFWRSRASQRIRRA